MGGFVKAIIGSIVGSGIFVSVGSLTVGCNSVSVCSAGCVAVFNACVLKIPSVKAGLSCAISSFSSFMKSKISHIIATIVNIIITTMVCFFMPALS
ncbi:MAG: hypothetical protein IKJ68_09795 [Clostridia bacterium]|nr:hypothetical protein [Clostridia bacterium]